jgi:hypothetical protein
MFTFVTNVTERVAAQLAREAGAGYVVTSRDMDDVVTNVSVDDESALVVSAAFRHARVWTDRANVPCERRAIGRPIVTRAAACTIRPVRER